MQHVLARKIVAILSRCTDMTVATLAADGSPQATVVSFVHDGLLLYFGCGATSQKAANLSRDRRISVAMTAPYRHWREIEGLSIAATAAEVTEPGEAEKVGRLMYQRFPQLASIEQTTVGAVRLYRVQPRFVSVLDYARGFGHTDVVEIAATDVAAALESMRHHWLVPARPER